MLPGLHCLPCTPIGILTDVADVKDDDCSICLEKLSEVAPDFSQAVEQLIACGHQFHTYCVAGVVQVGLDKHCPLCRATIDPLDVQRLEAYNRAVSQSTPTAVPIPAVGPSPCEQAHGAGWDPTTHWTSQGGHCGQSCPCCRYQVEGPGGFGVCGHCEACALPRSAANAAVPTPRGAPLTTSRPRMTFLYVVARKLGSGPVTKHVGPVLLMMGHRPRRTDSVQWAQWGIPGGNYDATDRGALYNAAREFAEEMGLMSPEIRSHRTQVRTFVNNTIRKMYRSGSIFRVAKNTANGYSAYALVVDNALAFEHALDFRAAGQDVRRKAHVRLSDETVGYTWVAPPALHDVQNTRSPTGALYKTIRPPTFAHPLRLRSGVLGPQLNKAFALARLAR